MSVNSCYHLVQKLLSSNFLSFPNIRMKKQIIINFPFVLFGFEIPVGHINGRIWTENVRELGDENIWSKEKGWQRSVEERTY